MDLVKGGADPLRRPAMRHDFRTVDQSVECIGSEFLTREDISVSEVSSVLQAGRSHHLCPTFATIVFAR
jgi:hypothetical protein